MADTGLDFPAVVAAEGEGEGLPNGLFRHCGPFCAGTLMVEVGDES
jgi:hypothetical protein